MKLCRCSKCSTVCVFFACFVLTMSYAFRMMLKIREGIYSMFKSLIAKHSIGRRRLPFLGMATHVTIVFPAASGSYLYQWY